MREDKDGFLTPHLEDTPASDKQQMLKVCPFNPQPAALVRDEDSLAKIYLHDTLHIDKQIGHYNNLYVGYSCEFRETSSSGGIATYLFKSLLERKDVTSIFIVVENSGQYQYQFFDNVNQITKLSKTRYIPVTMEDLFDKIDEINGPVAVCGVACFIKAIRLKQYYHPKLKTKITFLAGIICGGIKSKFFTEYLAQKAGINGRYFRPEYRIKNPDSNATDYSFGAKDENGNLKSIRMKSVGDMWGTGLFKSNACDFCDDVTTELADISLGDAWLEPYRQNGLGNSVIVTRSRHADDLISLGIKSGQLKLDAIDLPTFKRSQQGSFNHRQQAIGFRVYKAKSKYRVVPAVRERYFYKLPLILRAIQLLRMSTRSRSLSIWRQKTDANVFDKKMRSRLIILKMLTKFNHMLKNKKK